MEKGNVPERGQRFWLPLVIISIVVISASGYLYYRHEADRIRQQKYQEIAAIANLKVGQISEWRQERLADISRSARAPFFRQSLQEWLKDRNNAELQTKLQHRLVLEQKEQHYADVLLLDTECRVLLSAEPQPHPLSPEAKMVIEKALAIRTPMLSDLYRCPRGMVHLDAVGPIMGDDGQPVAVWVLRSNAESLLYPLIQMWPTPSKTAETLLVRRYGDDILFLNDIRHRPNTALSLREPLTLIDLPAVQAVLGKEGMFQGKDYRGVEVLADLRPVPESPWFMVAEVDVSEILAEARYRGTVVLLFAALFILLGVSAVGYGYRYRQVRFYRDLYRSEREKRAAQAEFRTTLYSIGDAVITTDKSGLVKQMNPTAERLTGWLETEATGKPVSEIFLIVNEDSREEAENPVQKVVREGTVVGLANHTLLIARHGYESPIADSGAPIRDESGGITGVVLVFRDQTEERRASKALQASEERYRVVADHIYDWEFWFGPDGRLGYCSPSCERVTGYSADEFISDPGLLNRIVYPEDAPLWDQHQSNVAQSSEACTIDYRIIHRNGKVVWIAHYCSPVHTSEGKFLGRRVSNRDITDRKNAEEALRESEERLRLAQDAAKAGTWEWDLRTNENFWSEEAWALYGLEPHSCKPSYEAWRQTIYPEDGEEAERAVQEAASKGTELNAEWRTNDIKGRQRWLLSRGRPIRNDKGQVLRYIGIVMDITDRKRSEEILRESEKNHRLLVENLHAGVVVHAPDTTIQLCNRVAARLLDIPYDEMTGKVASDTTWSFFREDGSPMPVDEFPVNRVRSTVEPLENLVVGIDRPSTGDRVWGLVNAFPALNEKNELQQVVVTFVDITKRKQAEAALAESEKRFRLLYEEAPVPYQSLDENGYLLDINAAWLELLGYSRDEVIGKSFADFLTPRSQDRFKETFPAFKRAGQVYGVEHAMMCKDKTIMDISIDGRISITEGGKFRRTHCVFQNITERKRSERALQQSEQRYRAVFNIASVGIDLVDQQGRFLEVNNTLSQFLGYTSEELQRLTILDVTHPEDVDRSRELHEAMLGGQTEAYRLEKRYLRKDGTILWSDTAVSAIRDADGRYRATVGVIRDITSQKRSEEARIRLATAVEQAAEGIVITDTEGTIHYVNPAYERITGYSRDEVIGQKSTLLRSEEGDSTALKDILRTLSRGERWSGHLVKKRKDGGTYEEDVTVTPVLDSQGKIVNFVLVKRDVTKEASLQRQLLQAQKMEAVGTLAGGVAHDFNNILQVALGYSELLLAGKTAEDPDHDDLQKIHHAARSGADLVRSLLTFSRKIEPNPVPMDLNSQIQKVEKLLHRVIPRMIDIRLELAEDLKRTNADPGQIEQVIMNLSVNARDAMGDKGCLTFRAENVTLGEEYCKLNLEAKPGDYVLLSVTDTGHGMDKDTLQHIFEPFYTTKELGRGTGLGLSMVYGIVKQHGGHIDCYSEVGTGTTFRLYFPAIPSVGEVDVEETQIMPALGTETVLIVDDEDHVRDLGERILKKSGYTVLTAVNGEEALEVCTREKDRIALIILDLIMPTMGGKDCLKKILEIDPQTKVLIASGYAADASTKECIDLGAKGFVAKPYRFKDLLQQVRKALDER